jgi:hypothetical protein
MNDDNIQGAPEGGQQPQGAPVSTARRRLLRGGVAAAPVLATFVSQPVHAAYSCKSASAFTSANASRPGAEICNGSSPAWWLANQGAWVGCSPATATFATYFSATTAYPSGTKLTQVLQGTSTAQVDKMARNLVAALLNIKSGRIGAGVFNEEQLRSIWLGAIGSGYVPITGGQPWYAQQVNQWLVSVFPAQT